MTRERAHYEICHSSVYWPRLDCDISSECLLRGAREARKFARKARRRIQQTQHDYVELMNSRGLHCEENEGSDSQETSANSSNHRQGAPMKRTSHRLLFWVSIACVTLLDAWSATAAAHHIVATNYYNSFSRAHPVLGRVHPGDTIATKTLDAGGQDENDV